MPARQLRPDLTRPGDWEIVEKRHVGPFLTGVLYRLPDGRLAEWTSRRHRKGLGLRARDVAAGRRERWWFRPASRSWWIGVLFMVGATCFAVGTLPPYVDLVGDKAVGVTFFVGSLFFTSAAYLQFMQAINAPHELTDHYLQPFGWQHVFKVEPHRIDWWATAVQFVGTLFFNVTTFTAMSDTFDAQGELLLVWFPNWAGSVCFLIASWLAIVEVCGGSLCRPRGDTDWWIVMINMLGSIFFMASAIGALLAASDSELAADLIAGGTFFGAVCFFLGAILLLPEAAETQSGPAAAVAS